MLAASRWGCADGGGIAVCSVMVAVVHKDGGVGGGNGKVVVARRELVTDGGQR